MGRRSYKSVFSLSASSNFSKMKVTRAASIVQVAILALISFFANVSSANAISPTPGWWKAGISIAYLWWPTREQACTDFAAAWDQNQKPPNPVGYSRGELDDRDLGGGMKWCYVRAPWQDSGAWASAAVVSSNSACPGGFPPDTQRPLAQQCSNANIVKLPSDQIYDNSCPVGNPIYAGTGVKILLEKDYVGPAQGPLSLGRIYRSHYQVLPRDGFGDLWQHKWQRKLDLSRYKIGFQIVDAVRPAGTIVRFVGAGAAWATAGNQRDRLQAIKNGSGLVIGWQLIEASSDATENYDVDGKLLSVQSRNSWTTTLTYSDANTPTSIAPRAGLLIKVQQNFGRALTFVYDPEGRISKLIAPDGATTQYSYDAIGMLRLVTWPDGKTRSYHYEDSRFPAALTGITDEGGIRFATYTYDDQGRAITSEHAGGVGRVQVQYPTSGQSVVTSADGSSRTYTFEQSGNVLRPTSVSAPCPECGSVAKTTSYDASGNVSSKVDFESKETRYTYDAQGRETQRIVGYGAAGAQTTTTEWHSTWRLPVRIASPGRMDQFVYDGKGQATGHAWYATNDANGSQGLSAPPVGPVATTGWAYDANGLMTGLTEMTDNAVTGQWAFTYDAQGNLTSATDTASGRTAQVIQYDGAGRLLEAVNLDGVPIKYTYDARGRVLQYFYGDNVTMYSYDAVGQKIQVASPQGDSTQYIYDSAHRLIDVLFNGASLSVPDTASAQLALDTSAPTEVGANPFSGWMGWLSNIFDWLFGAAHAQVAPPVASVALSESVSIPGTYTPDPWNTLVPTLGGKKPWEWLAIWTQRAIDSCRSKSQEPEHRGRIQAQGSDYPDAGVGDVEAWAQPQPLTVAEGLAKLDVLTSRMTKKQYQNRSDAANRARRFMINASQGGGTGPTKKTFQNSAVEAEGGSERVDIEVQKGMAFVP